MKIDKKYYGILIAGLAAIFWGLSDTMSDALIKLEHLDSDLLVSSKMLFAGFVLIVYSYFKSGRKKTFGILTNKKDAAHLLVFLIFGMMLMQLAYYKTMSYSDAPTATILQFTSPIFVVIWIAIATKTWPRRTDVIGLAFALLGTFLIVTQGNISSITIGSKALVWGIVASVTSALSILLPGKLLKNYGSMIVVGWAMFFGGLILNVQHPFWTMPKLSPLGIMMYIFVFFFGTVLAYFMNLASLRYTKASTVSLMDSFEPLAATVASVAFMHLNIGIVEIFGMILIMATAFIMAYGSSKEEPL
ncbi:peptide ABC transporter permease [Companilactobacillus sp. RD055328]|uniref:DMT family transporter n=1 Tax=Companilactobacillus sp. RD055328 TaxID=2916634 RepID=UPI001FC7FD94|nr:EamA family transporter [Companilactobacillus sp. RD055328]GKQ43238.1 peptide ABC transporter permease [Companilactobacillus sp. RD055328]